MAPDGPLTQKGSLGLGLHGIECKLGRGCMGCNFLNPCQHEHQMLTTVDMHYMDRVGTQAGAGAQVPCVIFKKGTIILLKISTFQESLRKWMDSLW